MSLHRSQWHRFVAIIILCGASALAGCGGNAGPDGVKVTGSVTKDGKAQSGVNLSFIAADQTKGESRGAKTDADGKFELKLRPGAYSVAMTRLVDKKGNVPPESEDPAEDYTQLEASGLLKNTFPAKLSSPTTTPFKVDIPAEGKDLPPFEVK
jgi:hypothetical protein